MSLRELLIDQGPARLEDILDACPRRSREELYRRLGIKSRKRAGFRLKNTVDDRPSKVHERLSEQGLPEELLQELVRNFLFTRRTLLGDALDFFQVPHDQGLTDQDLDFMEGLEPERASELKSLLGDKGHAAQDIDLYFRMMAIPE